MFSIVRYGNKGEEKEEKKRSIIIIIRNLGEEKRRRRRYSNIKVEFEASSWVVLTYRLFPVSRPLSILASGGRGAPTKEEATTFTVSDIGFYHNFAQLLPLLSRKISRKVSNS